jgi:hypothetical protein
MANIKYNVGDLVKIVDIKPETAIFPWAKPPLTGIYMGEVESTYYYTSNKRERITCYEVLINGQTRYISSLEEMKLLSSILDV